MSSMRCLKPGCGNQTRDPDGRCYLHKGGEPNSHDERNERLYTPPPPAYEGEGLAYTPPSQVPHPSEKRIQRWLIAFAQEYLERRQSAVAQWQDQRITRNTGGRITQAAPRVGVLTMGMQWLLQHLERRVGQSREEG